MASIVSSPTGWPLAACDDLDGHARGPAGEPIDISVLELPAPLRRHQNTDHSYSDHRIALESAVINWLQKLPQ